MEPSLIPGTIIIGLVLLIWGTIEYISKRNRKILIRNTTVIQNSLDEMFANKLIVLKELKSKYGDQFAFTLTKQRSALNPLQREIVTSGFSEENSITYYQFDLFMTSNYDQLLKRVHRLPNEYKNYSKQADNDNGVLAAGMTAAPWWSFYNGTLSQVFTKEFYSASNNGSVDTWSVLSRITDGDRGGSGGGGFS